VPEPLAFLPGLLWGAPIAGLVPLRRQEPHVGAAPTAHGIPVSIIVPARNEAETIDALLDALTRSTYDAFEVIVVDDCSTDDTAARVATAAARDDRVRLLAGQPLPEGWRGKPWACMQGAQAASGTYLIFTDADTDHAPELLAHVVGAMERDELDLLTLLSQQRCITFWERVIQPQILMVLAMRYVPARVNRATRADQVIANGQFIAMRRTAYDAIGGHASVHAEIVEDLALAQTVFRAGRRARLMYSGTLLFTRMYRSLSQLVEGWSKNLYLGSRQSEGDNRLLRALAPVSLMLVYVCWLLPFALLAWPHLRAVAQAAIASSLVFWLLAFGGMGIPLWYALTYPLGAVMALGITLRSVMRGGGRIEWRGRTYRVAGR
jgi:chlorobactene glucosyltransferase